MSDQPYASAVLPPRKKASDFTELEVRRVAESAFGTAEDMINSPTLPRITLLLLGHLAHNLMTMHTTASLHILSDSLLTSQHLPSTDKILMIHIAKLMIIHLTLCKLLKASLNIKKL